MNTIILRKLLAEPGYRPYLRVTVDFDQDVENPNDAEDWQLVSFNRSHANSGDPDEYFPNGKPKLGLARKLRAGTAFLLDYFEHGLCSWSLHSEGPQCRWDTARCAGLLLWNQPVKNLGPRSYEDRADDARRWLEQYTSWCNGEVYQYMIRNEENDVDAGCGGFFTEEGLIEALVEDVDGMEVTLHGQLAEMVRGCVDLREAEIEEEEEDDA